MELSGNLPALDGCFFDSSIGGSFLPNTQHLGHLWAPLIFNIYYLLFSIREEDAAQRK
jgi:hypothetical protein